MAENLIVKDLQKLDPGSELVCLYELEYKEGTFIYFMSGLESDLTTAQFRDFDDPTTIRTYTAIPAQLQGLELKNDGAINRPVLDIGNATTALSGAVGTVDYDTFLGFKFIKRTTLKKYLYNESGDANPPVEFPRQIYIMDRIKARDKTKVSIEMVAPFDISEVKLPGRLVMPDRCPFIYQGAGSHLDSTNYKKAQSGCYWHLEGKYNPDYKLSLSNKDNEYTVYVNVDDEYLVPSTTSFTLYTSGSVTKNTYYRTAQTKTRNNANGTTSSVSSNNFWQAAVSSSSPGTPADDNSNFKRVRIYASYSHGTEYFTFADVKDNSYVTFTDNVSTSNTYNKTLLWKAKKPSQNVAPVSGEYWERGDMCSKTTTGCKMRFGFDPITPTSNTSTGAANSDTTVELPYGGFPASKAFS